MAYKRTDKSSWKWQNGSAAGKYVLKRATLKALFYAKGYQISWMILALAFSNCHWLTTFWTNEIKMNKKFVQSIRNNRPSAKSPLNRYIPIGWVNGECSACIWRYWVPLKKPVRCFSLHPRWPFRGRAWLYSKASWVSRALHILT